LASSAHEKELKKRLQEVTEQLQIRERGTYSHSYYEGGAARHQELETELYHLRKTIKAERAKAVECYETAKQVANDPSSWAEKLLAGTSSEGGRFDADTNGAMKQQLFSAQARQSLLVALQI
jgi:hypothetical protein